MGCGKSTILIKILMLKVFNESKVVDRCTVKVDIFENNLFNNKNKIVIKVFDFPGLTENSSKNT